MACGVSVINIAACTCPPSGGADGVVTGGSVISGQIILTRSIGGNVQFALGTISNHSDVDTITTAPTAGQALAWDGTSQWVPTTISGGGGGGTPGEFAAINGVDKSVNAFSTAVYDQFDTGAVVQNGSFLTMGATTQPITTAGKYLVNFSTDVAFASDEWTVRAERTIANSPFYVSVGTGAFAGSVLIDWTAADVSGGESIQFEVTNNGGATRSIALNLHIIKVS